MEIEIVHLESEISSDVRQKMDKEQKDYYLRQKIKSIHDRLGDTVSQDQEAEDYRKKLADSAIPEEYKKKLEKEINHLESMPPMMAETAVARNYLDWVFSLPWDKETKDSLELKKARKFSTMTTTAWKRSRKEFWNTSLSASLRLKRRLRLSAS